MEDQANRPHRKTKEKKKSSGGPNPKAFAYAHPGRLQKQAARSHDVKEKRLHVPLVDRLPEEAPPIIVAVVGPPGVGKTTLIKSLIKRYTKHNLSSPTGPLTVVTSKRRRLTFLECPADSLASMIDVSKVADIVLLMIDGNYGFEMETMEFLNILSSSGMPGNVFGILTHLDLFRKPAALQEAKKRLKHRFWGELYQGAKLFYLSGVINGRYPDREIHNLSRFISVMKNPRPLVWRNSHPYCLVDRFLDITPPTAIEENSKCDRTVALYGYLRGTNFPAQGARVHVPGVGDLNVSMIEALPDPCPTPFMDQAIAKATGKTGRRRLGEKQKVLFAPMSDVGGVLVDKDAVYIDVKTSSFDRAKAEGEEKGFGEKLVMGLQGESRMLGEAEQGVRLFTGGDELKRFTESDELLDEGRKERRHARVPERGDESDADFEPTLTEGQEDVDEDDGLVSSDNEGSREDLEIGNTSPGEDRPPSFLGKSDPPAKVGHTDGDFDFADSDSDLGSDSSIDDQNHLNGDGTTGSDDSENEDGGIRWKQNLEESAKKLYASRPKTRTADLARMMYDEDLSPTEVLQRWKDGSARQPSDRSNLRLTEPGYDDDNDMFFKKAKQEEFLDDRMIPIHDYVELGRKWADADNLARLRMKFVSADLLKESLENGKERGENEFGFNDDDEGDGEFEDMETGEQHTAQAISTPEDVDTIDAERERNARRKEELKLRFEEEDREGFNNDKANERRDGREENGEEFGEDDWYDAQKAHIQKQLAINRAELGSLEDRERVDVEGHKAGTYARIVLQSVPCEFSTRFSPRLPIIVGGLTPTEDRFGFIQVRIKRHRWHKKILKTNDPLIFSLGWRRFQSLPIYSISDSRTRNRMLKYTPEHMHCFGTFYGPLIAPNSGFCCVQSFSNKNPGFRVAATGVVLNVDESTEIVKKLKLTGIPYKIFRNTAFIKDMFSTPLEIAKFEGASIRTVSGIRGQIKRALSKPEGHFRATFEDKVLMSDIVFLRAWYPIRPHRFYNPVTDLLEVAEDGQAEEARAWQGMRLTGEVRRDQGLLVPQQKNSAYRQIERATRHFNPIRVPRQLAADLPFKSQIVSTRPQRDPTYLQKRAVVVGGEEKKARDLMQKLMTLRNEKVSKRRAAQEERRKVYRKKVAENEEKKGEREKRERDDFWRREGKKRGASEDQGGGGRRKKTKR
ncbi:MAG: Glycoside hydrolase 2 (Mannanase, beta-galactosidase) [Sclerophora amabilis]|nr:MAG: Glycoside hydrolase 2 (Mannanase, beta-galactosidase) [Sclerophora amabilis]